MRPSSVVMQADDETEAIMANWIKARRARRDIERTEEECKTRLLLQLSAAGATRVQSSLGMATAYRTGGRTDWKGFALSLGGTEPPDRFKRPSTTWSLRAPDDDD